MSHLPVNHHLRPLYRTLAAACGLYVLVFGIAAIVQTSGLGLFAEQGLPWVLGLRANLAFAIVSVIAGGVLVAGAFLGGGLDRWINLVGGSVFLGTGMIMMVLLRTDANLLGFSMTTCIVSFVIGLVLLTAGLYGRTGSRSAQADEERLRQGRAPDPQRRARTDRQPATGDPATP